MNELIQRILILYPDANFSVYEADSPYADDARCNVMRSGFLLSWSRDNVPTRPPTQAQIDGV